MKRREFITLVGGAAAWPLVARAQQAERMKRVGVLIGNAESVFRARYGAFRDALAQLGWTEPSNVRIDYRSTDNKPELAATYASELVGLAPDVIFAAPGPMAELLQRLTRTIPIVFSTATDPVAAGYAQSFAHPGGNLTGFTGFEASINTKLLQLLKEVAPQMTRVAVLRAEAPARGRRDFTTIETATGSLAVKAVDLLTRDDAADYERVIDAFARQPNGGLIVPPGNTFQKHSALIVALAERHRLPAVYSDRLFVDAGGLMSYAADQVDIYRRGVASYVDRILRGAKPSDLPVQAPTKFELVVNLKTAKALGLTIPEPFLLRANEVIE